MLDPLSGLLFLIGIGSTLATWRRPSSALVLVWLIIPLLLGTTLTVDAPSTTRSLPALPALCLLIALGLELVLVAAGWVVRYARNNASLPRWWQAVRLSCTVISASSIGVIGVDRYWAFVDTPVHRAIFYDAAHEWPLYFAPLGRVPVTVVGPAGWPVEFITLYAPHALVCAGRWGDTWTVCPPPRLIIFDGDEPDALRYAAATGVSIHPGPSEDQTTRYWYAQRIHLPDPARVLTGAGS
jgi:hypothetical protein